MFRYLRSIKYSLVGLVLALSAQTTFAQSSSDDLTKEFEWRNIGPANMSGRISDIDVITGTINKIILHSMVIMVSRLNKSFSS